MKTAENLRHALSVEGLTRDLREAYALARRAGNDAGRAKYLGEAQQFADLLTKVRDLELSGLLLDPVQDDEAPARHTVAADAIITAPDENDTLHVLVIQRRWEPYEGCWALPGGHVDAGEPSEAAARRELAEETGVTAPDVLHLAGVFDTPGRDPRGHVISVAFVGYLPAMVEPTAADDAQAAEWRPVHELLATPGALAFDHHQILTAAVAVLQAN